MTLQISSKVEVHEEDRTWQGTVEMLEVSSGDEVGPTGGGYAQVKDEVTGDVHRVPLSLVRITG